MPGKLFHSHVIFNFVRSQGERKILQVHVQPVCHVLSSAADKASVQKVVFIEEECGNNI